VRQPEDNLIAFKRERECDINLTRGRRQTITFVKTEPSTGYLETVRIVYDVFLTRFVKLVILC
jgi:hypothetical protein